MIADNDEGNEGSQPAPKKSRASKPIKKSAVVISDVAEIPVEAASSPHTAKESGGATVSKPKKAPTGKKNEITPDKGNEGHEDEEDGEVLKMGDKLPSIKLNDEEGNTVDVSTLIGEKGVVFFLYPKVGPFWMEVRIHHLLMELKADTPGCTNQACGYRDMYDEIAAFGYEVYGLSKDTPTAQQKVLAVCALLSSPGLIYFQWKTKKSLTYHLLSDPKSKLIKRLVLDLDPT